MQIGKIGLGITTRNRNDIAKSCLYEWRKYSKNIKIVVVDDNSDIPFNGADYRFNKQAGIAKAKNKIFELLDDCEHIFVADDDVFPLVDNWYLHYINSGYKHLNFTFNTLADGRQNGNRILKSTGGINIFSNPCGVLMYFHHDCLDKVGGMDEDYGLYSWEHVSLSLRIHNTGLTPHPFMDVPNSLELFHSMDYYKSVESSVVGPERSESIIRNTKKFRMEQKSKRFIPYKPQKNVVLTCYFTGIKDTQRDIEWEYNPNATDALRNSLPDGVDLVVLGNDWIKHENPYLATWIAFKNYIEQHPEVDSFALVDATDVEMLCNPFKQIEPGVLYVGDERSTLNNIWLMKHHLAFKQWFVQNRFRTLLNAGVTIGYKRILLDFCNEMVNCIENMDCGLTDMGAYNYVLYDKFRNRFIHGRKVTTVFKAFDPKGDYRFGNLIGKSFFKHK